MRRRMLRLAVRRPSRAPEDLDEEIAFHVAERVSALIRQGWSPDDARAEALRRFGPFDETVRQLRREVQTREQTLQMRELAHDIWQDIRHGARLLRAYPAFGIGAALTLALGIGGASAMFAVVKHSLLDPLPFVAQDRLVFAAEATAKGDAMLVSYPNLADWRDQTTQFEALEGVGTQWSGPVIGADRPINARLQAVSRGLFRMLGVQPRLGRWISEDENAPGAPGAVVVSETFWREHLDATTNLSSVTLSVFGQPTPVVGVMPREFRILSEADLWFPMEIQPIRVRGAGNYWAIGRLRAGTTLAAARAELNGIAARLKTAYGDASISSSVVLEPLREHIIGGARQPLLILFGAAVFVLAVTCVNVAMMLLARGAARTHELTVRAALGASIGRLIRQTAAETAVLAVVGVAGGLLVAWLATSAIITHGSGQLPRLNELSLDAGVVAFAVAVAIAALAAFSLIPVVAIRRATRATLSVRGSGGTRQSRSWSLLIGTQAAVTLVLVVGASLLVRTTSNILDIDAGYDVRGVTTAWVPLQTVKADRRVAAMASVEAAVRTLPGVTVVAFGNALPLDRGGSRGPFLIPPIGDPNAQSSWAAVGGLDVVTPAYFAALKIPLRRGRLLDSTDRAGAPPVAVVNEALAAKVWPGQDPVGKQIRALADRRGELFTVVGVVGNAHDWRVQSSAQREMYVSFAQRPDLVYGINVLIRTSASRAIRSGAIERAVHTIDPQIPVAVSTLDADVRDTIADRRFLRGILVAFAITVVTLTIVGVFGAVSYTVARLTREIGVRIAIGASPGRIWTGILARVLAVCGIGTVVGLAISWRAMRLMTTLLYGISPHDLSTLALSALVVLASVCLAAMLPALRAASIDPSTALRAE